MVGVGGLKVNQSQAHRLLELSNLLILIGHYADGNRERNDQFKLDAG